eukprot:14463405-Heterocapsa_arctica.AAC.1
MRGQNTILTAMLFETNKRLCPINNTGSVAAPDDTYPKFMVTPGSRPMMSVGTEVFAFKDQELSDLRVDNVALQAQLSLALFERHEHHGHLRRLLFEHHEHVGHLR